MPTLKTNPNNNSVPAFLSTVSPANRKKDRQKLVTFFRRKPKKSQYFGLQASSDLVGIVTPIHLEKRWSGEPVGFSPSKQALSIYLIKSPPCIASDLNQSEKH
jgi:hypothetical protein